MSGPTQFRFPARVAWYRARVERDHLARRGTYAEWRRAEARVRELEPKEGA